MAGSFFDSNFNVLGTQMAQAWQKALETWWRGLLGDQSKLRELAEQLGKLGGAETKASAGVDDLTKVIQALELLERRQEELEEQVRALADNLAAVVTFLEKSGPVPAPRLGSESPPSRRGKGGQGG